MPTLPIPPVWNKTKPAKWHKMEEEAVEEAGQAMEISAVKEV